LARLEQEDLDEKMLKTGTVPVLPSGLNGPREFPLILFSFPFDDWKSRVMELGWREDAAYGACGCGVFWGWSRS
jgi:hypothetical protein